MKSWYNSENVSVPISEIIKRLKEFSHTELIVELIGPIIDMSRIPAFKCIDSIRYLCEEDIAIIHNEKFVQNKWDSAGIRKKVLEAIRNSKFRMHFIDAEVVECICRAKQFCNVKIVSTVPDIELFNESKRLLIEYSTQYLPFMRSYLKTREYSPLTESDIVYFSDSESSEREQTPVVATNKKPYTIVFDADVEHLSYTYGIGIHSVQDWVGELEDSNPAEKLEDLLSDRKRVYSSVITIKEMCKFDSATVSCFIDIKSYKILQGYYVYSRELRDRLNTNIDAIKNILDKESTSKPLCIFLAGEPGNGKSFFVEQFTKFIGAAHNFPSTSLSGVSAEEFCEAIELHVEQVYNTKHLDNENLSVAFLDEVDTKGGGHYAFRFLMDAMTGIRTDRHGVAMNTFKSGSLENLVWFFAGSGGVTRKEFVKNFRKEERKVTDFFDRIHFDLDLPSLDDPGQAILTLLNSIKTCWQQGAEGRYPLSVSGSVLLLFGCIKWRSARQIMTVCRIASTNTESTETVTLGAFATIHAPNEFHELFNIIKDKFEDIDQQITIKW